MAWRTEERRARERAGNESHTRTPHAHHRHRRHTHTHTRAPFSATACEGRAERPTRAVPGGQEGPAATSAEDVGAAARGDAALPAPRRGAPGFGRRAGGGPGVPEPGNSHAVRPQRPRGPPGRGPGAGRGRTPGPAGGRRAQEGRGPVTGTAPTPDDGQKATEAVRRTHRPGTRDRDRDWRSRPGPHSPDPGGVRAAGKAEVDLFTHDGWPGDHHRGALGRTHTPNGTRSAGEGHASAPGRRHPRRLGEGPRRARGARRPPGARRHGAEERAREETRPRARPRRPGKARGRRRAGRGAAGHREDPERSLGHSRPQPGTRAGSHRQWPSEHEGGPARHPERPPGLRRHPRKPRGGARRSPPPPPQSRPAPRNPLPAHTAGRPDRSDVHQTHAGRPLPVHEAEAHTGRDADTGRRRPGVTPLKAEPAARVPDGAAPVQPESRSERKDRQAAAGRGRTRRAGAHEGRGTGARRGLGQNLGHSRATGGNTTAGSHRHRHEGGPAALPPGTPAGPRHHRGAPLTGPGPRRRGPRSDPSDKPGAGVTCPESRPSATRSRSGTPPRPTVGTLSRAQTARPVTPHTARSPAPATARHGTARERAESRLAAERGHAPDGTCRAHPAFERRPPQRRGRRARPGGTLPRLRGGRRGPQ